MPEFYYEAIESTGALTSGTIDADSEADVTAQLAACELELRMAATPPPPSAETAAPSEAPRSEIRETLQLLQQATLNPKLRGQIRLHLASNENDTIRNKPLDFVGSLLLHCRKEGDPLTALGALIEFERDLKRVKNDSSGRFLYAYCLLIFASCMFSFTDYFVGDSFRTMFREFQLQLPTITLLMLKVGPLFWTLTISLVAVPLLIYTSRALFANQFWYDRGMDSILLWGPWRRWRYSAQALAYLGAALESEITLPQACDAAAEVLPRPFNAWQLRELGSRVSAGAHLDSACSSAKVHSMVRPFLLASERQGNLPAGCLTAARLLLERCRRRRMFFAYFIELFAMVFVLVTAMALFASYMWPIYSLFQALSR